MSTVQPATETKAPEVQKFTKKASYFDENLQPQEKEYTVEFQPAVEYAEAVTRLGNDSSKLLAGANVVLKREAFSAARKAAGVTGGINREVLIEWIKPYRELPQFASMIKATDKRKATAEEWDAQTNAILNFVRNVPQIIDSIKTMSASREDEE